MFIVLLFTASVAWAAPVDVTDFGAVGDGSGDDGPEIQAAIDSFENSLTGGTVYFPPGLYNVSNTIYVPSKVRLQGTGSTLYNTQIRLMLPQRALFEVTDKGANNVVFKDLLLISMVNGWPRTTPAETALIRTEGTVGISFKARNPGLSDLEVENVRITQFTHGIAATGLTGFNAQITNVRIRNYVSDGNEYSLYTNTYGANNWDVQNMNVFLMYDKQNGVFLERSGQMRFLQLSCAGGGAETCAKLWGNGDTYFRQMHVEGPRLGFCVGAHCRPTDPPGNMGENSSTLTVENSATNGEFHRLTNIVSVNNRFWLDFPQPPAPPPVAYQFFGTGANSSLKSCGNVWVSWNGATHTTNTTVNIPSWVFPGLETDPITVCSDNDLTSVPIFSTGYDPDDERLEGEKDIRDYGAIADDDNNDFDAFKAAIHAAISSRGRRVYVPPGRFDIYDSLVLERGITIVGELVEENVQPSEIRLHGQGVPLFTIFNTPVLNETLMQGIGFRNLLLTSESDDGTIGINFENYSPKTVGPASDFHIQNVDFDGFGIGITVRPFGGVFENPNPMFDTVSIKDGDFTRNRTAILLKSANASHWNMEDIRVVEMPAGGEGVRINGAGHASIRNLSCNGDTTATACVTIQRQTGTAVENVTATGVISALDVPWENGYTQFPITLRNSNLLEGVYFQGRIYLNSVNNQYPAELEIIPFPFPMDRKVVRFGAFQEGNTINYYYGGQSDVFSCSDLFIDPLTQQTETRWTYTGVLEKRVTYCD